MMACINVVVFLLIKFTQSTKYFLSLLIDGLKSDKKKLKKTLPVYSYLKVKGTVLYL